MNRSRTSDEPPTSQRATVTREPTHGSAALSKKSLASAKSKSREVRPSHQSEHHYGAHISTIWDVLTNPAGPPPFAQDASDEWRGLRLLETDRRYARPFEREFCKWVSECKDTRQVTQLIEREGAGLHSDATGLGHALYALAKFGLAGSDEGVWRQLCRSFASLCLKGDVPSTPSQYEQSSQMAESADVTGQDDESSDSDTISSDIDYSYAAVAKFVAGPDVPSWVKSIGDAPRPLALVLALQALELKNRLGDAHDEDDIAFGAILCSSVQPSGLYQVFLPQEIAAVAYALAKLSRLSALRPSILSVYELFPNLALSAFPVHHVVTLLASYQLTHRAYLGLPTSWVRFFANAQADLTMRSGLLEPDDIVRAVRSVAGIPGLPEHTRFYEMVRVRVCGCLWRFNSHKLCSLLHSMTTARFLDPPFFVILAKQVVLNGMSTLPPQALCRLANSLAVAKCDCDDIFVVLAEKVEMDIAQFSPEDFALACSCFSRALEDHLLPPERITDLLSRIAKCFLSVPLTGVQLCRVVFALTLPLVPPHLCDAALLRSCICTLHQRDVVHTLPPASVTMLFQTMVRRQLKHPLCRAMFEQCLEVAMQANWHDWGPFLGTWAHAARTLNVVTQADARAFANAAIQLQAVTIDVILGVGRCLHGELPAKLRDGCITVRMAKTKRSYSASPSAHLVETARSHRKSTQPAATRKSRVTEKLVEATADHPVKAPASSDQPAATKEMHTGEAPASSDQPAATKEMHTGEALVSNDNLPMVGVSEDQTLTQLDVSFSYPLEECPDIADQRLYDEFNEHCAALRPFFRAAEDVALAASTPQELAGLLYVFATHAPSHKAYRMLEPKLTPFVLQELHAQDLAYTLLAVKLYAHATIGAAVHADSLFQNVMREICVSQSAHQFEGELLTLIKGLLADLGMNEHLQKFFDGLGLR